MRATTVRPDIDRAIVLLSRSMVFNVPEWEDDENPRERLVREVAYALEARDAPPVNTDIVWRLLATSYRRGLIYQLALANHGGRIGLGHPVRLGSYQCRYRLCGPILAELRRCLGINRYAMASISKGLLAWSVASLQRCGFAVLDSERTLRLSPTVAATFATGQREAHV